jgi:hypothetical protein
MQFKPVRRRMINRKALKVDSRVFLVRYSSDAKLQPYCGTKDDWQNILATKTPAFGRGFP